MPEGVTHTRPIAAESYVVFSVANDLVAIAALRAWAAARKLGLKSIVGCYRDRSEYSFVVNARDYPQFQDWTRDQESFLILGPSGTRGRRPATLRYRDGTEEDLGVLHSCARDVALKEDFWTYDPSQSLHFICSKQRAERAAR
jgi:hypothetical protein